MPFIPKVWVGWFHLIKTPISQFLEWVLEEWESSSRVNFGLHPRCKLSILPVPVWFIRIESTFLSFHLIVVQVSNCFCWVILAIWEDSFDFHTSGFLSQKLVFAFSNLLWWFSKLNSWFAPCIEITSYCIAPYCFHSLRSFLHISTDAHSFYLQVFKSLILIPSFIEQLFCIHFLKSYILNAMIQFFILPEKFAKFLLLILQSITLLTLSPSSAIVKVSQYYYFFLYPSLTTLFCQKIMTFFLVFM